MSRNCFVISPIGPEESEVREHADDVFDFIIEPAAKRADFVAQRADHTSKSGKITEQMYDAILTDEFIIAVLTYQNPNVYYELAVAQAAARPTILLIEKGHVLPFDIKDLRVIYYDLRPRSIKTDRYVDALYQAIKEMERDGMKGEVPFRPSLTPLGATNKGLEILDRTANLTSADYLRFIGKAKQNLMLSGFSLFFSWHTTDFEKILREKSDAGCAIKVLIMHEDNPAVKSMLNTQIGSHFEHAINFIKSSMQKWSGLAQSIPTIEIRKVLTGVIFNRLTINESEALITPHLYSVASTSEAPLIRVPSSNPLYAAMTREYEQLWAENAQHSNRRPSNLTVIDNPGIASR
jgi:hypothetical protein